MSESDAELACVAVAQQLLGIASERCWIRYARTNLAELFPQLPGQSGYGKRLRASGSLLAGVITELARDTASWHDHGGRALVGVYARVAARPLALAAAICHNWRTGAPVKRSLIAYDH
jgi:hypothetical protein